MQNSKIVDVETRLFQNKVLLVALKPVSFSRAVVSISKNSPDAAAEITMKVYLQTIE